MSFSNLCKVAVIALSTMFFAGCSASDGGGTGGLATNYEPRYTAAPRLVPPQIDAGLPTTPDAQVLPVDAGIPDAQVTPTDAVITETPVKPEPVIPGICDVTSWDIGAPGSVKCNPGETKPALCFGSGLTGTRTCIADGTGYSRATCARGGTPLNQEADFVMVTRWNIYYAPGFGELRDALGAMGGHTMAVVTADDLVSAFPAPTVPESIRAGLQFLKGSELPKLRFAIMVGKTDPYKRNTQAKYLSYSWELPLWYVPTPPRTDYGDGPNEEFIPTLAPYAYLSGPWSDIADQFWTPEAFTPDLRVGYLPARGANVSCTADGVCLTDLQVYANKLRAWKSGPFKASQFHASQCAGEHWYDLADLNAQRSGVTETIVTHNCANGESGDAGELATADGSNYLFYAWHGGAAGSWNYDETAKTGYVMADVNTKFDGIQFAYSCSTAIPDNDGDILGEKLMFTPGAPIVYVGYDRTLMGDLVEPMAQAFVAGRWTLGEAVDGFKKDIIGNLRDRYEAKALMSLLIYGNPALTIAPGPSMVAMVLASRTRSDGDTDACVQARVPSGVTSGLLIGNRKLTDVSAGWWNIPVVLTRDEVNSKSLLHLDACDPAKETCQAGQVQVQRDLPLHCGSLFPRPDGSYDLDVTAPTGQEGSNDKSLVFRVSAVVMNCADGIRSDCFADVWPGNRSEVSLADVPVSKVVPGVNRINFQLDLNLDKTHWFRALRVILDRPNSSPVGSCYVPMSQDDATDYHLL
jgi:hypothetical protein